MDLKDFFLKLTETDQKAFAELAGTSVGYIKAHLLPKRKIPRRALMDGLVAACRHFDPRISKDDVLRFFYLDQVAGDESSIEEAAALDHALEVVVHTAAERRLAIKIAAVQDAARTDGTLEREYDLAEAEAAAIRHAAEVLARQRGSA